MECISYCDSNVDHSTDKKPPQLFEEHIFLVNGKKITPLRIDIIKKYIASICQKMKVEYLDIDKIANNVYPKLKTMNTIKDIEEQIISSSSEMVVDHYDYPCIATWILISNLHSETHDDYAKVVYQLKNNVNKKGKNAPIVSVEFANYVEAHIDEINNALQYDRDYQISLFGYRTLEKAYLKKLSNGKIIERPQHMYMRVAIALHFRSDRMDRIVETYNLLSQGYFTHATPTLFNAGTTHEQLSSCFLLGIGDDMSEIGECWKDCAIISKYAGGIGINVTNIRVDGAYIHSTQGKASGMRLLMVFNQIARYADQGGKRAGSIAIYIEPWHGDIFFFLDLRKNSGAETERARDLFLALMINDIFMKRVEENGVWSLMCPAECPELLNKFGEEFTRIYEEYESKGKFLKQIRARDLWFKILDSQIETGVPYFVYKDSVNYKSNQINIGVVNGSNLCAEIVQVSSTNEYAVCFTENTEILTIHGMKKIIDCHNEDVYCHFNNDNDLTKSPHYENAKLIYNGVETVYYLKSDGNKIIEATKNHPFLVFENNKYVWKKLQNLKKGDLLYTPMINTLRNFSIDKLDMDNRYINVGYLYSSVNDQQANLLMRQIQKLKPILQASFLSGIFSENGHVQLINHKLHIVLNMNHLDSTYQIQQMLIPFGIRSKVSEQNKQRLEIYGVQNITNFQKYIDFTTNAENKQKLDDLLRKPYIHRTYDEHSEIVYIKEKCQERVYDLTLIHGHHFMANGHIVHNCNLASICLPKYIKYVEGKPVYDYQELYRVARIVTRNLNNIIDINFYPVPKTRVSNMRHRPIGVGVQGLADVFAIFKTPFDSELARDINRKIFETIYYGALTESMILAKEYGPYETYHGSPISESKFQFDLWKLDYSKLSGLWDWEYLRGEIKKYGVRNSLVTTCMPTASTSQIMGNNECIEPYTENIYTRTTIAGDYYIINKHLMKDLIELGIYNEDTVDLIKYYQGSIANIPGIPQPIKDIYRTVWEIDQKSIVEMAAERGPFIDQTQSMNIFIAEASYARLTSCLFDGWKKGLKTGMYYLRSKAASGAGQFGIDIDKIKLLEFKYHIVPKKGEHVKNIVDSGEKIPICKYVPKHLRKPGDCDVCSA